MGLQVDAHELKKAIQLLGAGDVIGLPTETVYGLAARIDQPEGLNKIFQIKQRPFFDPLIVHVDSVSMAKTCVQKWPLVAEVLAQTFWPGPLTLVLQKSEIISDLITSGLDSVGVRCPNHPVALDLLSAVGVPLAAPSANRFGRTSPTEWQHVETEFQGQVFVLKAAAGQIGIESTVLKIEDDGLSILRPGMITKTQIDQALQAAGVRIPWKSEVRLGQAPGQMKHHYMPPVPLVIVDPAVSDDQVLREANLRRDEFPKTLEGIELRQNLPMDQFKTVIELKLSAMPELAARQLYTELRRCGQSGHDLIFFRKTSAMQGEHWAAILERLTKAASLKLS